ncbi:MAG: HAD-IA family hydrolase [Alphaproteobacteria bacterium]|nr:HAD-IA family hydrolase [Alphaproteobacteria bacterium]
MRLTDFDVLTFDLIGTIIDFEGGILGWMRPRVLRERPDATDTEILEAYARCQAAIRKADPKMLFSQRMPRTWEAVAKEFGVTVGPQDGASFLASARAWPPFPDSAQALAELKRWFRYLVVVTNGDRTSARTMVSQIAAPSGRVFDEVITEEDIGWAKPDPKAFEYFILHLEKLGVQKKRILHVAQSQYHDMGIAKKMGLATCWIYRRHGQKGYGGTQAPEQFTKPDFLATSLGDLVRQYQLALKD